MFSGHGAFWLLRGISPGHEFVDLAHGPAIDEAGEDIGEIGLRIQVVSADPIVEPRD